MHKSALLILQAHVKSVHTELRAGGAPYWTHPIRCHKRLVRCWSGAPLEVEIAMLFHDTLEDIDGGKQVIRSALDDIRDIYSAIDNEFWGCLGTTHRYGEPQPDFPGTIPARALHNQQYTN